jgi:thiopeptide-type bacteriocin biosynthesis protein
VSSEEAESYIHELIDSQILVPDVALAVTGAEPIHPLIAQFRQHAETAHVADALDDVRAELAAIDADGLGVNPERYRAVARRLESLPAKVELPRLFQVDMVKPSPEATLGKAVVDEIARGVEILHRMARPFSEDALSRFRDAFTARYEQREAPLLEALDEEVGIGFGSSEETSPLLQGLYFPPAPDESVTWGAREVFLLRKLSEALQSGVQEIVLEPRDWETMESKNPPLLPDAFAVMATVAADSEAALAQGNFRVVFDVAYGPSGARLLGRFCHADENLRRYVEQHLRAEEAILPDTVFAEIVHLPEGRIGNVLARPVLRDYEIPYLGYSSAPAERQIPVSDLMVSVQGGRIVLRSQRLGREVIPRMTNAHNFSWGSLGVYRFLCSLQMQEAVGGVMWDWGALQNAPFLPRVTTGRLVLSLARWRVSKDEIKRLSEQRGAALFQAVQAWRAERRLPRWIALTDADNTLPVDLDNVLGVETFVHLIKGREEATLTELFPTYDELCAQGPEGRFTHEVIVPFVKVNESIGQRVNELMSRSLTHLPIDSLTRRFPLGSEWLYAKLYTGTATADGVLREVVAPLVRGVLDTGAADGWFFIRYGDPDWHLRLRFHGDPARLHTEVLPALQAAVNPLLNDGRLWRVQLDTYECEVERYGGAEGIALAERLFHTDSEAVLKMVTLLEPGDEGLDERWRLALRGMDALLNDLGFDLNTKLAVMKRAREGFGKEFRADKNLASQLSDKFRKERKSLESLLNPDCQAREHQSPARSGERQPRGRVALQYL